jgi:hypothetical protein
MSSSIGCIVSLLGYGDILLPCCVMRNMEWPYYHKKSDTCSVNKLRVRWHMAL